MAPAKKASGEPSAVDLIEEAVHLLRRHPRELAVYYLATGPFALALLYAWAHVTWFSPADGAMAAGALLLVGLFAVMKAGQHHFARCLLAARLDEERPVWSWRALPGAMAAQLRLHAVAALALPLAAVFGVPFGWCYAYFHNATILPVDPEGGTAETRHVAWAQALLWPRQNHVGLAILSALWAVVFLNVAAAFLMVPGFLTDLLGLKTIFAISGWSFLNSSFLCLMAVLTHLLVDPLIRAFYVLRVFYGRARRTGADLRLVLARERRALRSAAVVSLVVLLAGIGAPRVAQAATEPPPAVVASGPVLATPTFDRAMDRVLAERDFRWRLRPLPPAPDKEPEGLIRGFVRSTVEIIGEIVRAIVDFIARIWRWVEDLLPDRAKRQGAPAASASAVDWMAVLQVTAYLMLAGVILLVVFAALKLWRVHRVPAALPEAAAAAPSAVPDLRADNVEASRLPADGWIELARQQMAAGEWRLALRALFLATLARLAHERLLTLARFKTNLDYERELGRRAHGGPVLAGFRQRRREFEEVWYGATPTDETQVHNWLRELEARP